MGWKGRHDRNWVFVDIDFSQCELEVRHNESSNSYGMFGVVDGYDDEYHVIWRPNRNYTSSYYVKVMSERGENSWGRPTDIAVIYHTLEAAKESIANHWQANFLHPPKRVRYRPRDSQKGKVYRWEHVMARDLGPKETDGTDILHKIRHHVDIRLYLKAVRQELGEKLIELKFRSGGSSSFGGTGIRLLPCHCNHLVTLHELAHVLHKRWGTKTNKQKHQAHGKEYVGIYAYLLIRFAGIDKSAIIRHAREHKVNLLLPEQYWEWKETESKAA